MNNFFNSFLGKPQDRNNILTPPSDKINPDDLVKSRRDFLKAGAVAGISALGIFNSTDILAAEFQPKNQTDLSALGVFLNGKILTHPNADDKRIFNDAKILEAKYKSGDFVYYEPKNPDSSKYRKDFVNKSKSHNKSINNYESALIDQGYETVSMAGDFVFVAEIENAGNNDSLYNNGLVIMKKGTKISRKKTTELDKNGKPIYQNFIHDCFNPIYALACIKK